MRRTNIPVSTKALEAIEAIQSHLDVLRDQAVGGFSNRGMVFEKELLQMCEARGLKAKRVRRQCSIDMIVQGKRVQCKATESNGPRLRLYGGNKLSYDSDAFDVLAIRVAGAIYFVPSQSLRRGRCVKLKSRINLHQIRKWRDAWSVFDSEFAGDQEPCLFDAHKLEATDGPHPQH
jgi:hypothetical protein